MSRLLPYCRPRPSAPRPRHCYPTVEELCRRRRACARRQSEDGHKRYVSFRNLRGE